MRVVTLKIRLEDVEDKGTRSTQYTSNLDINFNYKL